MILARCFAIFIALAFSTFASSPQRSDAVKLVDSAAKRLLQVGPHAALAEFSDGNGRFAKGELYLFVYDLYGRLLAHPGNHKLLGKNMIDVPDVEGKPFRREIVSIARLKGEGWVNYKYRNPVTGKVEDKTTWVRRVGDLVLCSGVYHLGDEVLFPSVKRIAEPQRLKRVR